jgi:hypothetical protein
LYLKSKNVALNVLLVPDNASGNLHDLGVAHPSIQVQYLSNTTTSVLQSLNQGIITIFKSFHTHHTFHNILDASEESLVCFSNCHKLYGIVTAR